VQLSALVVPGDLVKDLIENIEPATAFSRVGGAVVVNGFITATGVAKPAPLVSDHPP
jgi:hypothetical protein